MTTVVVRLARIAPTLAFLSEITADVQTVTSNM
jgi:hypothetical protein